MFWQSLVTDKPGFGNLSWFLGLVWLIGFIGGIYLYQSWREVNPVRARFVRQAGLGFGIISGVGLLVLLFKLLGIPFLSYRLWTYLVVLATVIYGVWTAWFATQRLPSLAAAAKQTSRRAPAQRAGAKTYPASTTTPDALPAPRPVATTGRRDARREKKRKGR